MAALLFGVSRPKLRALAIATLLITVPLSLLLASNNNQANAVRNFFMGIVMFGIPLLFHAWLISFITKNNQSNQSSGTLR